MNKKQLVNFLEQELPVREQKLLQDVPTSLEYIETIQRSFRDSSRMTKVVKVVSKVMDVIGLAPIMSFCFMVGYEFARFEQDGPLTPEGSNMSAKQARSFEQMFGLKIGELDDLKDSLQGEEDDPTKDYN